MRRVALLMALCALSLSWGAIPTLARSFTFTTFDVAISGTVNTVASGINIFGQVVGGSADVKESAASFHGYSRDPDGSLTLIDVPFSGASGTVAAGINVQGVIVGGYLDAAGQHCFVLNAGVFKTIDVPFPNAFGTRCRGINEHGQIVGTYFDANVPNPPNHGFLLNDFFVDDRSNFSKVPDFPGAVNTLTRKVNNRGQIVGFYSTSFPRGPRHGFLFERGEFRTIDYPNAKETRALDISNNGQIVGDYVDSDNNVHAFSLERNNFVTVEIPGITQNTGGLGFRGQIDSPSIYAVNDRGQIGGVFLGDDGHFHGFIGTPTPF